MRVRRRGNKLLVGLVGLVGLICAATLTACANGSSSKPIAGVAATTGPITVATNLSAFSVNDAIGVTISNASGTDYYAMNGKSACVIIQLERYDSAKRVWTPMDPCATQIEKQAFAIAKNSEQQFTLAPNSSADPNAWSAGLYRVSVSYSTNSDGVTGSQQANCAAFRIS
jgi:hypothetical protein